MIDKIKSQFKIFNQENPNPVVFLDSGASSLTPDSVIDAITKYYKEYSVNIHRGLYKMSEKATDLCEISRNKLAKFINAENSEIIFTSGTTMGLNMLSQMLKSEVKPGDNIVISIAEHHANILPWQKLAKEIGNVEIRYIKLDNNFELDIDHAKSLIDSNTKIVSITGMSNVMGMIPDCKKLGELAHEVDAYMIIDAAQSIAHKKTDVKELNCDFLAFGAHKMYGPTGVGVLYGKQELLQKLNPVFVGGDIVSLVTTKGAEWVEAPHKFETGTPHIAGIIAFGDAVDFIESIGWDYIKKHEEELNKYALTKLNKISGLTIIGPSNFANRGANYAFTIDGIHTHDVADILAKQNIAVRAGSHCAMPLSLELDINGTTRASCGIYSTKQDIDKLVTGLEKVINIFKK